MVVPRVQWHYGLNHDTNDGILNVGLWPKADIGKVRRYVRFWDADSTGRRNTRVTLTKRSPNRFQGSRLPPMPKLRFLAADSP